MARDRAARPEAKALRLFVAVDVPSAIKAELDLWMEPYRDRVAGARWTRPEGWHLTLKFLGPTWPRLVDEVLATVKAVALAGTAVESSLTEVGAFPSARRARVLWAGLADPDGRLAAMARDLDQRLRDNFRVERRPLTPHLTLARFRSPGNLERDAPGLVGTPVPSASFVVDSLVLYRSHLSPRGARYEAVHRAALGGGDETPRGP